MAARNTKRVPLEKLFRWSTELEITDHEGEIVGSIFLRVLNERDIDKARIAALGATRELRLKLRDEASDERGAMLENLLQLDKDAKVSIAMLERMPKIYEEARRKAKLKLPRPPGDDGELEEIEEYEHQLDTYNDRLIAEVSEIADNSAKALKEKLEAIGDDEFEATVLRSMENQICVSFMSERFDDEIAWRSVFVDSKFSIPYFDNFEAYNDLSEEIKEQIKIGYKGLTLTRGTLKN